jgi:glycosyltransferase involved in cell wall biosynthesis
VKILQVTASYPPYIGGVEFHVYNLARALQFLNNDVNIITSNYPGARAPGNLSEKNVIRLPILCKPMNFRICPSIFKYLKKIEADVVHIHAPPRYFPGATTFFYKFYRKVPLVITNHAPLSEHLVVPNYDEIKKGLISLERSMSIIHNRLFYSWVHKNVQRIIVQGEAMRALLLSIIFNDVDQNIYGKIRIIPNGVNSEVFNPKIYDVRKSREKIGIKKENVIVFIGRLARHKGVDCLIRALQFVKIYFPDVLLLVVGDGIEKCHLEYLCRKLEINSNVKFLGSLPYEDVPLILSSASVLVHPSFYEGIPTVVLEAMSMVKPVVVTDAGCMPEVVEDQRSGLVVEKGNIRQLANAITQILSDNNLALRMGERGRILVEERYDWNVIAKKHLEVYREVLGKSTNECEESDDVFS